MASKKSNVTSKTHDAVWGVRKGRKSSRVTVESDAILDSIGDAIMQEAKAALPNRIQSALSGLGEPPQFGNSVTLANIQQAIRTAARGETYYLFALFRDMIENDSHIQAEMGKRIMSFMGQNESIEPIDKNNKEDVQAAEIIKDMIDNCDNWREGSLHLANGHIWPIAGAEKIFEAVKGSESHLWKHPVMHRLKRLHPVPYPLFNYKVSYWNVNGAGQGPQGGTVPQGIMTNTGAMPIQDVQNITALGDYKVENQNPALIWNPNDWHSDLRFYSTYNNGLIDWTMATCYKPDPIRHVLHSANVATNSFRENFGGVLRGLIPWWFFSQNGRDWFARAMERYGSPWVVAKANTSDKNIFDLLTKAFNQATKTNALIVPPQASIEVKEVQYNGMADGFAKFIELCNTEKTKAILGQTLSTSSKGSGMMGGSGVADLHSDVKEEWALFDKRSYCDMQWKQIFEPFLRVNGYKGRCKSVRGGINPAQQSLQARTLQSLSLAGIFVDPSEEQTLTNTFGIKLIVKDLQKIESDAKAESGGEGGGDSKQKKSKADKKRYGNPA